jgi:hypothetical protein
MNEFRPLSYPPHWSCVVEKDVPFHGSVALGNGTQWLFTAVWLPSGWLMVAIDEHGSYRFNGFVHWSYAMEKLGLLNGDAMNVADWINAQLCLPYEYPSQGHYQKDLCFDKDAV